MFARTLTATAIVAGALAFSMTGASAASPAYGPHYGQEHVFKDFGKGPAPHVKPGQGFDKGFDKNRPGVRPLPHGGFAFNYGKPVCQPVYAQQWRWSPWAGWYLTTVKVDEKCNYPRVQPRWPW